MNLVLFMQFLVQIFMDNPFNGRLGHFSFLCGGSGRQWIHSGHVRFHLSIQGWSMYFRLSEIRQSFDASSFRFRPSKFSFDCFVHSGLTDANLSFRQGLHNFSQGISFMMQCQNGSDYLRILRASHVTLMSFSNY